MHFLDCPTLHVSVATFLFYSVEASAVPYLRLISPEIVTYRQLAVYFALRFVLALFQVVLTGHVAEKARCRKFLLLFFFILGASLPSILPWMAPVNYVLTEYWPLKFDPTTTVNFSWNESTFHLETFNAVDSTKANSSLWIDIHTCYSTNCNESIESMDSIRIQRGDPQSPWSVQDDLDLGSCQELDCSASILNATYLAASQKTYQHLFQFPVFLMIRSLISVCCEASIFLFESIVSRPEFSTADRPPLEPSVSWFFIPLLTGVIVDGIGSTTGNFDYTVVFAVSLILALISSPLVCLMKTNSEIKFNKLHKNEWTFKTATFRLVQAFAGFCSSFHAEFLVIFFTGQFQCTKTQLGLAISTSSIGSMIGYILTPLLVYRLSPDQMLNFGFVILSVQLGLLYIIQNLWLVIFMELFHGFSRSLFLLSGHISNVNGPLSPIITTSFIVGGALGASVGSAAIGWYGIRTTYLLFAAVAALVAPVHFVSKCWMKDTSIIPTEGVELHFINGSRQEMSHLKQENQTSN